MAHLNFDAATQDHESLFYNSAGFLFKTAITDGALFGRDTLEDVRQNVVPNDEDGLILRSKESALDQPKPCLRAHLSPFKYKLAHSQELPRLWIANNVTAFLRRML